ncbi:MAG: IS630 family transposase [Cyanobacteria bacterium P01_D01_bin.105]
MLGVHAGTVAKWWRQYQTIGKGALWQAHRGRQRGDGRTLTPEMEVQVESAIRGHFPEEYGIDSALWTRRAIRTLIEQLCHIRMPVRTVGEYLKRWGYSPQRPLKRAYEQDPAAIAHWVREVYPKLQKRALAEGAHILWGDESGLRSDDHGGRGYAPIGHTPEIRLSERQRGRINYIASLSNTGVVRYMLYTGSFTGPVYLQFLNRLIQQYGCKVFWIGDRHPVHLRKLVTQWLEEHPDDIEAFYLPPYSPHLNPVEYLNGEVKQAIHDKPPTRNLKQLKKRVSAQLRKLQHLPHHVQRYFQHPDIAYAVA